MGGTLTGGALNEYEKKKKYVVSELKTLSRNSEAYIHCMFVARGNLYCSVRETNGGYYSYKNYNYNIKTGEFSISSFQTEQSDRHIYTNENDRFQYFAFNTNYINCIDLDLNTTTGGFISSSQGYPVHFNGYIYTFTYDSNNNRLNVGKCQLSKGSSWTSFSIPFPVIGIHMNAYAIVYKGSLHAFCVDYANNKYYLYRIDVNTNTTTLVSTINGLNDNNEKVYPVFGFVVKNDDIFCAGQTIGRVNFVTGEIYSQSTRAYNYSHDSKNIYYTIKNYETNLGQITTI